MRRATTPTHIFTLPDEVGVTTIVAANLVYSQDGEMKLKKSLNDLIIDENKNALYFTFTQDEATIFAPAKALTQLRVKTSDGAILASQMIWVTIKPVLDSEGI